MEYNFTHQDSLETIIDEITGTQQGRVERKSRDQHKGSNKQNATNRTFNAPRSDNYKRERVEVVTSTKRPKFNLRDAVILSEILKPKFDE